MNRYDALIYLLRAVGTHCVIADGYQYSTAVKILLGADTQQVIIHQMVNETFWEEVDDLPPNTTYKIYSDVKKIRCYMVYKDENRIDGSMKAFITGSRAYGIPREDSDIDLVVAVNKEDYYKLWDLSDNRDKLVFGRLNLVAFNVDRPEEVMRYEGWKAVNDKLVDASRLIGGVAHEQACKAFAEAGVDSAYTESRK